MISRSTSGEWILAPSDSLTSEKLRAGIAGLNAVLAGGPTARIATALMRLISATRRPSWMDEEVAQNYFETLQEAMHDYPIDVVEDGCKAWRRGPNGEWWPAEKELRRTCDGLFESRRILRAQALRLLAALESEEERDERARQPSAFAGDRGREFRNTMRSRMTPARFAAYFDPSHIQFAGESLILVRSQTAERVLSEEGADELKRLGLKVRYAPQEFTNVRHPTWEDDTPAEREEVARKFNLLKVAMAGGGDIAKMRKDGTL